MVSLRSLLPVSLLAAALTGCGDEAKPAAGGSTSKPEGSAAAKAAPTSTATATSAAAAGPKVVSCSSVKEESSCKEFGPKNIEAAGLDFLKSLCTGKGTYSEAECPKDKRVGSCATPEGTKVFYADGPIPFDAAKGEKACKEGVPPGEWKAGG
jgi:hypothetical protein